MADERKNGNGKMGGMMCNCGYQSGGGRHWTFFLLRTLLTILILMVVFWFGVMAGRLGDGGRAYMMRGYSYQLNGINPGGPMLPVATSTSGAM